MGGRNVNKSSGFRVQGLGFRVQGLGFRVGILFFLEFSVSLKGESLGYYLVELTFPVLYEEEIVWNDYEDEHEHEYQAQGCTNYLRGRDGDESREKSGHFYCVSGVDGLFDVEEGGGSSAGGKAEGGYP